MTNMDDANNGQDQVSSEPKSDLVFETKDEKRYAPGISDVVVEDQVVDVELERDLRKIPEKIAFKIGEVAEIVGVKAYVLRYWETEFDALKPEKSRANQRMFTRKDVETVMMIKKLLYRDRFSIEGARSALRKLRKETKNTKALVGAAVQIEELRDQVHDLLLAIRKVRQNIVN